MRWRSPSVGARPVSRRGRRPRAACQPADLSGVRLAAVVLRLNVPFRAVQLSRIAVAARSTHRWSHGTQRMPMAAYLVHHSPVSCLGLYRTRPPLRQSDFLCHAERDCRCRHRLGCSICEAFPALNCQGGADTVVRLIAGINLQDYGRCTLHRQFHGQ